MADDVEAPPEAPKPKVPSKIRVSLTRKEGKGRAGKTTQLISLSNDVHERAVLYVGAQALFHEGPGDLSSLVEVSLEDRMKAHPITETEATAAREAILEQDRLKAEAKSKTDASAK